MASLKDLTKYFKVVSYDGSSAAEDSKVENILKTSDDSEHNSKPGKNFTLLLKYTGPESVFTLTHVVLKKPEGSAPLKTAICWVLPETEDGKDVDVSFSSKFDDLMETTWKSTPPSMRPFPEPAQFLNGPKSSKPSIEVLAKPVAGKYLVLKFIDSHADRNIDVGTVHIVGKFGKHADFTSLSAPAPAPEPTTATTATSTSTKPGSKLTGFSSGFDWSKMFSGSKTSSQVSKSDMAKLVDLGILEPTLELGTLNKLHKTFTDFLDRPHVMLISTNVVSTAEDTCAKDSSTTPLGEDTKLMNTVAALRAAAAREKSTVFFYVDPSVSADVIYNLMVYYAFPNAQLVDSAALAVAEATNSPVEDHKVPNWTQILKMLDRDEYKAIRAKQQDEIKGVAGQEETKNEATDAAPRIELPEFAAGENFVVLASFQSQKFFANDQDAAAMAEHVKKIREAKEKKSTGGKKPVAKRPVVNKEEAAATKALAASFAALSLDQDETKALETKYSNMAACLVSYATYKAFSALGADIKDPGNVLVPRYMSTPPAKETPYLSTYPDVTELSRDTLLEKLENFDIPFYVVYATGKLSNVALPPMLEVSRLLSVHSLPFRVYTIDQSRNDLPEEWFPTADAALTLFMKGPFSEEKDIVDERTSSHTNKKGEEIRAQRYPIMSQGGHSGCEDEDCEDEDEDHEHGDAKPEVNIYHVLAWTWKYAEQYFGKPEEEWAALFADAQEIHESLQAPSDLANVLATLLSELSDVRVTVFGKRRFAPNSDVAKAIQNMHNLLKEMRDALALVPAPLGFNYSPDADPKYTFQAFADRFHPRIQELSKDASLVHSGATVVGHLRVVARQARGYDKYFPEAVSAYADADKYRAAVKSLVDMVGFEIANEEDAKEDADFDAVEEDESKVAYISIPSAADFVPAIMEGLKAIQPKASELYTAKMTKSGFFTDITNAQNEAVLDRLYGGYVNAAPPKKPAAIRGKRPTKAAADPKVANSYTRLVVTFYTAPWAGVSEETLKMLSALATQYNNPDAEEGEFSAIITHVNVDAVANGQYPQFMQEHGFNTLPTFTFTLGGDEIPELRTSDARLVEEHMLLAMSEENEDEDEDEDEDYEFADEEEDE